MLPHKVDGCKKKQNLVSNLKAVFLPTLNALLHPVQEVNVMRRDCIQLPLTS
jgi:hypothetical protein